MKKGLIIAGIILVLIGAAIFVGALAASGFDFKNFGTGKYETNTHEVEEPFDKIDVSTREGNVSLRIAEDGKCAVVCVEREKMKHTVSVENGTLKVTVDDERSWLDYLHFGTKETSVTLYLPATVYASIAVSDSTGDVTVPKEFSFGTIDLKTSTGDIRCDASATGYLKATASTGDVNVNAISASEVNLSASTGSVRAESVACLGDMQVHVSTGRVNLKDVTCKNLTLKDSTGRITLTNVIVAEKLSVDSETGDVRLENSDAAEIYVKTRTGDVTGTLLTEKIFIAKASTGDVDVPPTLTGGRCEIKTSTGDIRIKIATA